jgi:hypothetical protein
MAIPASVLLYANWSNGSGTYTAATPDKPDAHTYSFNAGATIAVEAAAPWSGQSLAQLESGTRNVTSTLSAATAQATSGRYFFECTPIGAAGNGTNLGMFEIYATVSSNGIIRVRRQNAGNIEVLGYWSGGYQTTVSLGAESANPYCVEVIYDTTNGTAASRLKARMWDVGGSPPSFTDSDGTGANAATDQFTTLGIGDGGNGTPNFKVGRIAISNDITEDLSALDEGAGAAGPAIGAIYRFIPRAA